MVNGILRVLLSFALVTSCRTSASQEVSKKSCDYDRARLLALNETQFDQDMSGGWRTLSSRPGCELAAADLLHDFREAHHKDSGILYWHEAQVRAGAGQYQDAIALMERARMSGDADKGGWNPYVDATIAFLRRDRAALADARVRLAAVQPPVGKDVPPVIDGIMEVQLADGSKRKMRWPPNIDVVEGLESCFDKPYNEAYSDGCRPSAR